MKLANALVLVVLGSVSNSQFVESIAPFNPPAKSALVLTPATAVLLAATKENVLWMTAEEDVSRRAHAGAPYFRFTYYVVGNGVTNTYLGGVGNSFKEDTSYRISPNGSVLLDGQTVWLSPRDARDCTNGVPATLRFEADWRSYEGWTFSLESPSAEDVANAGRTASPRPLYMLRLVTPRVHDYFEHYEYSYGARVPLYAYPEMAEVRMLQVRVLRDDWKQRWPFRSLRAHNINVIMWNGLDWRRVDFEAVTRVLAAVDVDYIHDENGYPRRYRIMYRLTDDGQRVVNKVDLYVDPRTGERSPAGIVRGPPLGILSSNEMTEVKRIIRGMPPSTAGTNEDNVVSIERRDGEEVRRKYPCEAVPDDVMRLLELLGGLRYEAREVLRTIQPLNSQGHK